MRVKDIFTFFCLIQQIVSVTSQLSPWYNFYRENKDEMTITDGILPTLSCPFGHYRDFSKGIMLDGCVKCPKGYFGNTTDLQSSNCTAPCPAGTYLDRRGGTSIDDCIQCPAGTYGEEEGLTKDTCSGRCSGLNTFWKRYYSSEKGLASRKQCEFCPIGFDYHDCTWKFGMVNDNYDYFYANRHEPIKSSIRRRLKARVRSIG